MNENNDAWGHPGRYYSVPHVQSGTLRNAEPVGWQQAVKHARPQARSTVERTVRLWNQKVRTQLMNEIGFQLKGRHVAVRVVDGLPAPLSEALRATNELAPLMLKRTLLESVVQGTGYLIDNWDTLKKRHSEISQESGVESIEQTQKTAQALLERIQGTKVDNTLRDINEDVLGAYFFNAGEIQVYWLAIAIFAELCGVSVESLAFVVLAHELAHAYTHLGSDIDGQRWSTHGFASTDIAIVEGLAQFYTEVVCRNLDSQMPDAMRTFETLLDHQGEVYNVHRSWTQQSDWNSGEIIRVSLVECRRSGNIVDREDFLEAVERHRCAIMRT